MIENPHAPEPEKYLSTVEIENPVLIFKMAINGIIYMWQSDPVESTFIHVFFNNVIRELRRQSERVVLQKHTNYEAEYDKWLEGFLARHEEDAETITHTTNIAIKSNVVTADPKLFTTSS